MTAMWNERKMEEENKKYWRNMHELAEQECMRKRNAGVSCRDYCSKYKTESCRHPEAAKAHFPY